MIFSVWSWGSRFFATCGPQSTSAFMSSLMSQHANNPFAQAHNDVLLVEPESDEEREKVVMELKNRGNAAFKSRRPMEALLLYSRALEHDVSNYALFGNRSAVNEMLGRGEDALSDAESAIEQKSNWAKGFFRKGNALKILKRYNESTEAFRKALAMEPDSKSLKKALASAKKLETKMATEAKAKADKELKDAEDQKNSANSGGAAPVTIVTKSEPNNAKTAARDVVQSGEKDLSMRGYKKTADGRTTSFYHRDIDDEAKKLIGSIAPKKIEASAIDASSAATSVASSNSASVWNQGGTYEERDASSWATSYIENALLKSVCKGPAEGTTCAFTKVAKIEGDASLILRKQEKRYVFDWEFEVEFEVSASDGDVQCSGTFSCADFDSEAQGDCEVTAKLKSGANSSAKQWAKGNAIAGAVNLIWGAFSEEYRNRY